MNRGLLVLLLLTCLSGCKTNQISVGETHLIADYPEKGWRMFPSPRDSYGPGTVRGYDEEGGKIELTFTNTSFVTMDEGDSSLVLLENKRIQFGAIGSFITQGIPAIVGLQGSSEKPVTVSIKMNGVKRHSLNNVDLEKFLFETIRNPEDQIFNFKSYDVIRSVLSVTNIQYKFSSSSIRELGGEVTFTDLAKLSNSFSWESGREYQLSQSFKKPMNIFYHSSKFDVERVLKIKEKIVLRKVDEDKAAEAERNRLSKEAAEREKAEKLARWNERTRRIRVTFENLDIYLDGSTGQDQWSAWCNLNGQRHQIWDRRRNISDDCTDRYGRGPNGDRNACRYPLNTTFEVLVRPNQDLVVQFEGRAHDDGDSVPLSSLVFNRSQDWGIGKGTQKMGNYNRGQTEYYVYFSIIEIVDPALVPR